LPSFVFQNHCTNEFRLYDAIQRLPNDKIIVLSPKPNNNNPSLKIGATVYLWEAGKPYRGLVARGVVEEPLKDLDMPHWQHQFCQQPPQLAPRSIIRIERIYEPPLGRDEVREKLKAVLIKPSFFRPEKSPSGTIFRVDPALEPALDQLQ
jgi:hypothetical protein